MKTSEERLLQAKESGKECGKHFVYIINNTASSIWNLLKSFYCIIDAGDKKIGEGIEKNMQENGKNIYGKFGQIVRKNIIKTLSGIMLVGGISYGVHKSHQKINKENDEAEFIEGSYIEKFGDDDKVFVLDVSENNEYNDSLFRKWNEGLWDSKKDDVRGVSGIYLRIQKENGEDVDYKKFFKEIEKYNKDAEKGQEIAVGGYIYFNKNESAITDDGIEKQVDSAISRLSIINNNSDGIVDLIPMLDFEYSRVEQKNRKAAHPNENYPLPKSEVGQRNKKAVLKRLQLFEEKTGITPGIYTGGTLYYEYFLTDPDFEKYPVWIASYNEDRVNQSEDNHSVKIGPIKNPVEYQPELIQFSDEIKKSGFGTEKGDNLDGSTATKCKFQELIRKNSDAPTDLK